MEGWILFFLLSLIISYSTADNMVSEVIPTLAHKQHNFSLPNSETVVLVAKTESDDPQIRYQLYVKGSDMSFKACIHCYKGSLWMPLLMITKQATSSILKDMDVTTVPEDVQSLESRNLVVTSNTQMDWQVFPLPLINTVVNQTTKDRDFCISLPEDEVVWIAYRGPSDHFEITFNLQVNGQPLPLQRSRTIAKKDWSLMRVHRLRIDYEDTKYLLGQDYGLTGRKLELYSVHSLDYQIFTVPLKPDSKQGESKDTNMATIVPILVILLLIIAALFLWYKLAFKRRKDSQSQGTAPDTKVIIDSCPVTAEPSSPSRPNSTHESENSIYGAVIDAHCAVTRQNSSHDSENSVYGVIRS